jgi:hypothetical protein
VITIREDYSAYVAPKWVRRTVERLLNSLSESHLTGLSAIVLTNAGTRKHARRSRRNRRQDRLGSYCPPWQSELAWIELVVDEIVKELPRPLDKLQLLRDLAFGRVLFHEIGHHLHQTRRGLGRTGESSAEAWESRLSRIHFRKRYRYLRPLVPLLTVARNVARRLAGPRRRT